MYNHQPFGPYEKYFKRPIDFICGMAAVVVFCWLYVILIIRNYSLKHFLQYLICLVPYDIAKSSVSKYSATSFNTFEL